MLFKGQVYVKLTSLCKSWTLSLLHVIFLSKLCFWQMEQVGYALRAKALYQYL